MAVLYWRGGASASAGGTGEDWNTISNWYTPIVQGTTNGLSTVLIPANTSPRANDTVRIYNVLPFPISGSGLTSNTPILANCSTGGMLASGTTYAWSGAAAGFSYGPLALLEVGIIGQPAAGYTYSKFAFNANGTIPLFWKSGTHTLTNNNAWMSGVINNHSLWTSKFYGVLNSGVGYTLANHNTLEAYTNGITSDSGWSRNLQELYLKGSIGKFHTPTNYDFFGYVFVDQTTTVSEMQIRGQPHLVYLPVGTTCNSVWIEPTNRYYTADGVTFTTRIEVGCNVGITTNQFSSASANDYNNPIFQGIRFRKSTPSGLTVAAYQINIGFPSGSTAASTTLHYNLWEENITNIRGGEANIGIVGSCFINDMLLEDSKVYITNTNTGDEVVKIKKGELRGFSILSLEKSMPTTGFTLGVPTILGEFAAANRGQTGAEGLLLSSRDCQFIPHPLTTVSF